MKRDLLIYFVLIQVILLSNCSGKNESNNFIDQETIDKDDNFRSGIKDGNFIRLTLGFTYYEFENRDADTLLVLVHGFSVPSYIWDSTFQAAIKKGYGVLRYDTYGRGYSDNPNVVYNANLYSNQLRELLDSLAIDEKINLVGLSDGGRTITAFAAQYPDQIQNLVYVDAVGFDNMTDTTSSPSKVSDDEVTNFKQSDRYSTMASGQLGDFYDSIPFRGWDKKYQELMRFRGFVRALISTNKNRSGLAKEHGMIAASGIPVFAIWGEHDKVVPLKTSQPILKNRIPNAQLFIIPKAGHLPHMEQTQMFNDILFSQVLKVQTAN